MCFGAGLRFARCISGGPIYITDSPGEHDIDLIHQMTAKNPRGDTIILRPSNVGKTLDVYIIGYLLGGFVSISWCDMNTTSMYLYLVAKEADWWSLIGGPVFSRSRSIAKEMVILVCEEKITCM